MRFLKFIFLMNLLSIHLGLMCRADLGSRIAEQLGSRAEQPSERKILSKFHYFFVDGFMGDFSQTNFNPLKNILTDEWGVETPSIMRPPSSNTFWQNADLLYENLKEAYVKNDGKPIIMIAHSFGGAAALYCLMKHPELIEDEIVSKLVVVQGALGGSPLGALGVKAYPILSKLHLTKMPALERLGTGFKSLDQQIAKKTFREALSELQPTVRSALHDHIFYVRAHQDLRQSSKSLMINNFYLNFFGKNDGMVLVEDQILEGIGTEMGLVRADHNSLLDVPGKGSSTPEFRKAFGRALLLELVMPIPRCEENVEKI